MNDRKMQLLSRIEFFSELDETQLGRIAGVAQFLSLPKDKIIFNAGDQADAVFVVASGKVKIVVTSADGKELILAMLGAGQVFGEMALLESSARSASVITETAVELLAINRDDFQRILGAEQSISHRLLAILSERLRRANSKMQSLAYIDVAGRLARYFMDLAKDHGQRLGNEDHGQRLGNGWVVVRRPTHADIANSIGTSRETVSRLINEFEESFGMVNKGKFTYIREELLS